MQAIIACNEGVSLRWRLSRGRQMPCSVAFWQSQPAIRSKLAGLGVPSRWHQGESR